LQLIKRDFNGVEVAFQGTEMISLTDLWIASDKDENRAPKYWRRKEGQAFIKTLAETLNVTEDHLMPISETTSAMLRILGLCWQKP